MTEIRVATAGEAGAIGRALARAFEDDPVMCHLFPPGSRSRHERLARFMAMAVDSAARLGSVFTTPDHAGAAVWRPPGQWRLGPVEMLRSAPAVLACLRTRARIAKRALDVVEAAHPVEPHWYLQVLGTEPASQGRGVGAAAMAPVLGRCDAEGVPAHLESSKASNVPYYERHGFVVTAELTMPDGGPTVWEMWREPRTPAS